jgi:hypothetical protein
MLRNFARWQKYDVGAFAYQPNRRLQNRQQMEDSQRKRCGIYIAQLKKYEKEQKLFLVFFR